MFSLTSGVYDGQVLEFKPVKSFQTLENDGIRIKILLALDAKRRYKNMTLFIIVCSLIKFLVFGWAKIKAKHLKLTFLKFFNRWRTMAPWRSNSVYNIT